MQKYVINFIINDMYEQIAVADNRKKNLSAIGKLVDDWQNGIYFIPSKATKINHLFPKNYKLM